jgi:hypothetical protein
LSQPEFFCGETTRWQPGSLLLPLETETVGLRAVPARILDEPNSFFRNNLFKVTGWLVWTGSSNRNGQQDRQRDSGDSAAVHGTNLATKGLTMHAQILQIASSEQKKIPSDVKKKYQNCKPAPM